MFPSELADRFWSRVEQSDGCRPWRGTRNVDGYGVIGARGKQHKAHRVAWELTHGAIPAGMLVCHHCDNPPCCNPDHLFLGTVADNARDMVRKGRSLTGTRNPGHIHRDRLPRGDQHYSKTQPERVFRGWTLAATPERQARGERNGRAVLTEAQVREIRARYAAGGASQQAIADAFGLNQITVSAIVRRKTWKHVE